MLDDVKLKTLIDAAEVLAQQQPAAQQDQFKVDFVEVMTKFNERLDANLDDFEINVTPVVVAYRPHQPAEVSRLVGAYRELIHGATENLLKAIQQISNPAVRKMIVDTIRTNFDAAYEAVASTQVRHEIRNGEQLD